MTAPTISATPKLTLDQRATSRHDKTRWRERIGFNTLNEFGQREGTHGLK
jgi:hypothetical protein